MIIFVGLETIGQLVVAIRITITIWIQAGFLDLKSQFGYDKLKKNIFIIIL